MESFRIALPSALSSPILYSRYDEVDGETSPSSSAMLSSPSPFEPAPGVGVPEAMPARTLLHTRSTQFTWELKSRCHVKQIIKLRLNQLPQKCCRHGLSGLAKKRRLYCFRRRHKGSRPGNTTECWRTTCTGLYGQNRHIRNEFPRQ